MPVVRLDTCMLCGGCEIVCRANALQVHTTTMEIDSDKCTNCGNCINICPMGAIGE